MKKQILSTVLGLAVAAGLTAENRPSTFYEGFEGRGTDSDFSSHLDNNYLPQGWTEISKVGHKNYPEVSEDGWDCTWRTLPSNGLFGNAFKGNCYANVKNIYGADPSESDEWLITPSITVQDNDVLYFYVAYNAYFTLRPDQNDGWKPTGKFNPLDVMISTDNGETWSDPLWSTYDDAMSKTPEELFDISMDTHWYDKFSPVFIDLDKYYGKTIKVAFRYYGKKGTPVSIDDVTVGIPYPEANYSLPEGYFMPALMSSMAPEATPLAYASAGNADTWVNNSILCRTYEWTYTNASGSAVNSEIKDLVTPEYPAGTQTDFPVLNAFYGQNQSGEWSMVNNPSAYAKGLGFQTPKIQYGGNIAGEATDIEGTKALRGVGTYNIYDPDLGKIVFSTEAVGISADIETRWYNIVNDGTLLTWDFLQGMGTLYPQPAQPYGLSYVYTMALVEKIGEESNINATIYEWEKVESGDVVGYKLGKAIASAKAEIDPEAIGSGEYTNIMFDFGKNPVTIDGPVAVIISGYSRGPQKTTSEIGDIIDEIYFPFITSTSDTYNGTSIGLFKTIDQLVDDYLTVYSPLNETVIVPSGHCAGILMGLGIENSTMELVDTDNTINMPKEGGEKTFTVKSSADPSKWGLTENGQPCEWAGFEAKANGDTYDVTIKVSANTGKRRQAKLALAAPGSFVNFIVDQEAGEAGIDTITPADNQAPVEYFNLNGVRVENPSNGVFIRRQGTTVSKVIVK